MMKNPTLLCINKDVSTQIKTFPIREKGVKSIVKSQKLTYFVLLVKILYGSNKSCLESICKEFKMSVPNLNSAKRKCPNCI